MDIFLRIQTKFKYLDSFSQIKKKISYLSIMYVVFFLLTFQSGNLLKCEYTNPQIISQYTWVS